MSASEIRDGQRRVNRYSLGKKAIVRGGRSRRSMGWRRSVMAWVVLSVEFVKSLAESSIGMQMNVQQSLVYYNLNSIPLRGQRTSLFRRGPFDNES